MLRLKLNVQDAQLKVSPEVTAGAIAIIYNNLLDLDNLERLRERTHRERNHFATVRAAMLDELAALVVDYKVTIQEGETGNDGIPF